MVSSGGTDTKRRVFVILAALGAAAYVGGAIAVDSGRLRDALSKLGLAGCGLVLALSLLNYFVRFGRWHTYIGQLGRSLPIWPHLSCYLSGLAFTVSPGKMGEAVRSVYLHKYGVPYAESIATLLVERLLDLLTIVLLASLIALDHPRFRPLVVGVLLIALFALAMVTRAVVPNWIERLKRQASRQRVIRLLTVAISLMRSSRHLLQLHLLLFGFAVGLLAWGAEGIGFYLVCQGLHIPIDVAAAVGVYALAVLAGSAAFFLPAGLGGVEIVMTTLLIEFGAPARLALIATLVCRLATLWFAVILGVVATAVVELRGQSMRLALTHE
jgi:uncharacterized protein (TIRG00374 family)